MGDTSYLKNIGREFIGQNTLIGQMKLKDKSFLEALGSKWLQMMSPAYSLFTVCTSVADGINETKDARDEQRLNDEVSVFGFNTLSKDSDDSNIA